MAIITLRLTDLGSVPLVYDSGTGRLMQDPNWVRVNAPGHSANVYGPADVFKDAAGNIVGYQEAIEEALVAIHAGQPGQPSPSTPAPSSDPRLGPQVGRDAGGAIQTTVDELIGFLMRPVWPGNPNSIPTGLAVGGLVIGYSLLRSRRGARR